MADNTAVTTQPDHYALYYPFIHIRDEEWLKAAVLSFQQVRRIVPSRFAVRDFAITRPYSEIEGPVGPMLTEAAVYASPVAESQRWLEWKIREHLTDLVAKYSRERTPTHYQSGEAAFQIHYRKFAEGIAELLVEHKLAWHSRDFQLPDAHDWITLHPRLGAAVMSILALSIARGEGLDIVTPSISTHEVLLGTREDSVFEALLEIPRIPADTDAGVTTEELTQVVISTGFDLSRLTPENIATLLREKKDLRIFRKQVSQFAAEIPAGLSREERLKRMKEKAENVLEAWNEYKAGLPGFALKALSKTVLEKVPEKLIEIVTAGTGTATGAILGAAPGILLSVVSAAGIQMYRQRSTPFRFLNRLQKATNKSFGALYVPQWSKIAL